jgi:hypothetical protein
MNRTATGLASLAVGIFGMTAPMAHASFTVIWGTSWDGASLQDVLDAEYGVGAIDAATDYEGFKPEDMDPPYWRDDALNSWIVREIAGFRDTNIMGWYKETCRKPCLDDLRNQVIFTGPMAEGATVQVTFPCGTTKFGFYLNPNGTNDSANAPEPELFFTNRCYNDDGPRGHGTVHEPTGGDPQCLIYNVTRLRGGVPSFVLAWEDLDSGGEIAPSYAPGKTDNDFQDLVVEISAASPMPIEQSSWGRVKTLFGGGQ